jgi:DNA-binding GntR family transcriptional regulator
MRSRYPEIQTVHEQIAGHIRSDILAGTYPSGTPLREQPLAKRFGVSRGPIREVLLKLTQEGLLVSEPNCGVKVSTSPSEWLQPLIVRQRLEIEIFALRKSISVITADDIKHLNEKLEVLSNACRRKEFGTIAECDIAFHRYLLECAGEEDLIAMWLPLVTRMIMNYSRHTAMSQSIDEHKEILQAIKEKDLARAIRALKQNIR